MNIPSDVDWSQLIEVAAKKIAERDIEVERGRTDRWIKAGRRYEEIRAELRMCEDNAEGHAEFYRDCVRIIFGDD